MLIGLINNIAPNKKLYKQCLISMLIVTFLEFITGYILNIKMELYIWNYQDLHFFNLGQGSLLFSVFWFFLSVIAIWLDDYLRYKFYNEKKPSDLPAYIKNLLTFKSSR
ncbi:putative ABC transporter permease [Terrisporobacter sp.]